MDDPSRSEGKTLRVEGRGCVFGGQVVLGYPPKTETQVQFRVSMKSGELQSVLQCHKHEFRIEIVDLLRIQSRRPVDFRLIKPVR
jgi:hypothetical protein